ncbi:MAG: site-specific DNA-methyltransferase [Bacteroidales bacterium]|nr:site-specific DNA-methyltransferase [Bacteroidales bacterium]
MRTINFDTIKVSKDWAFENARSTDQWTHGYHRYPAKFLPNVVKKLIESYASPDFVVADLFAGCGTTLVEAKVHGIRSVGTDINPIATLITRVKTTPINPQQLERAYNKIVSSFETFREEDYANLSVHEKLDYWFRPKEKYRIAHLYQQTNRIRTVSIREFFLVAISHILKNCSGWLQSSTKPQRDLEKNIPNPFDSFKQHCAHMMKGNLQFYNHLSEKGFMDVECSISQADARHTAIADGSVDIIITSPPYVTSYEYADIHQLTGYWMEYFSDINSFRKLFIGTSYSGKSETTKSNSILGDSIVEALVPKDKKVARDVSNYFDDMRSVAQEMYRIVKKRGYACIVIGNTTLKDIHIKSAEVFYDFLKMAGFKKVDVIKRNIPNKLMPTLRDKTTGKFTTLSNQDCKKVYPDEYIIIVKK